MVGMARLNPIDWINFDLRWRRIVVGIGLWHLAMLLLILLGDDGLNWHWLGWRWWRRRMAIITLDWLLKFKGGIIINLKFCLN
jgi:hypothetical protein